MIVARHLLLLCLVAVAAAGTVASPAQGAYGFIQEWGGAGSGPGRFTDLRDVATDANGNVFTAEAGRLQKFGPTRGFLLQRAGEPGGELSSVAVYGAGATGVVYAIDRTRGVLRYRASDLVPLGALPLASVPADWGRPRAVTVDYLGNVIVAFPNDEGTPGKISGVGMWDAAGSFIRAIGAYGVADVTTGERQTYETPVDVDDDGEAGGKVWVVDAAKRAVFSFERATGANASRNESTAPSWEPRAVAVMPLDPLLNTILLDRSVYVADHTTPPTSVSGRLWAWKDPSGFLGRFGTRGAGPGEFGLVSGIEIDGVQRMFVADATNAKVLEYGNGGAPGPGDPKDPDPVPTAPPGPSSSPASSSASADPLTASQTPLICNGLWAAATCGWLPKPAPLAVCVSYWENCNGFMGMKPAKPGTIDLSGFPSQLVIDVQCGPQATSKPKALGARPTAVTAQSAPGYLKPDTECLIEEYLNGTVPKKELPRKEIELLWNIDARAYKAEVAAAYAVTVAGLRAATEPMLGDSGVEPWGVKAFFFLSDLIDRLYDDAAIVGRPVVVPEASIQADRVCAGFAGQDATECAQLVAALNGTIKGSLRLLAQRKKTLFLDMPFEQYYKLLEAKESKFIKENTVEPKALLAARGRDVTRRPWVLARAQARLRQGTRGTLRLTFPKATRAYLRRLRRAGVKTFDAQVVTRTASTPANARTTTVKIKVSLVKVRRKR